ncbi:MAG: hypothetical protein HY532_04285 [Chloroflexi bacterium]|nr:hypothetical protein [Chloroflexota bacterium]
MRNYERWMLASSVFVVGVILIAMTAFFLYVALFQRDYALIWRLGLAVVLGALGFPQMAAVLVVLKRVWRRSPFGPGELGAVALLCGLPLVLILLTYRIIIRVSGLAIVFALPAIFLILVVIVANSMMKERKDKDRFPFS